MAGSNASSSTTGTSTAAKSSWLPLFIVMMCQIQLSFNAFNVSIAGITEDLDIPATAVGTALTTGTFAMASFILLVSKMGAKFGVRRAFQIGVLIPGVAALLIATAQSGTTLFVAQALSGASVALSAPALTVLIASNYRGRQQAQAIGFLASATALAQVISLLIAGWFASTIGRRWSFVLMAVLGAGNFTLSWLLKPIEAQRALVIDWGGAALVAVAVILISFGFSGLNAWGFISATPDAPFAIAGRSPVPILLIGGAMFGQAFYVRTRRRMKGHQPPLLNLSVLRSSGEKATIFCMMTMLFVGTAASFLLPLYMQVVQGLSGIQTSFSIVPYTISIFVANTLVVRLYDRFSPRQIAPVAFVFVGAAFVWLALTINNDWGQIAIVVGLVVLGLAQGCIVALVFNTLLSSSPPSLSGDVGALRGLVHNLSGSAGISVATALAVGLLGGLVTSQAVASPVITTTAISQVNLDNVNFITNEQLNAALAKTTASPAEVDKAVVIYEDARLRALKITMLVLAGLALLAVIPSGRMPGFSTEELPVGYPKDEDAIYDLGEAEDTAVV